MTPWTLLIEPLSRLLDVLIPGPEARARAQFELLKAERESELEALRPAVFADGQQNEVTRQEAAHGSLFVAGWQPFIGWVCGAAFAYHFILQPLLAFALINAGQPVNLPAFDMDSLFAVLLGMLGLESLRTLEKIRGAGK